MLNINTGRHDSTEERKPCLTINIVNINNSLENERLNVACVGGEQTDTGDSQHCKHSDIILAYLRAVGLQHGLVIEQDNGFCCCPDDSSEGGEEFCTCYTADSGECICPSDSSTQTESNESCCFKKCIRLLCKLLSIQTHVQQEKHTHHSTSRNKGVHFKDIPIKKILHTVKETTRPKQRPKRRSRAVKHYSKGRVVSADITEMPQHGQPFEPQKKKKKQGEEECECSEQTGCCEQLFSTLNNLYSGSNAHQKSESEVQVKQEKDRKKQEKDECRETRHVYREVQVKQEKDREKQEKDECRETRHVCREVQEKQEKDREKQEKDECRETRHVCREVQEKQEKEDKRNARHFCRAAVGKKIPQHKRPDPAGRPCAAMPRCKSSNEDPCSAQCRKLTRPRSEKPNEEDCAESSEEENQEHVQGQSQESSGESSEDSLCGSPSKKRRGQCGENAPLRKSNCGRVRKKPASRCHYNPC